MRASAGATLSSHQRLKSQQHFRAVYQRGRRAGGRWLTVVALLRRPAGPNDGEAPSRLGVSVSKDHGGSVRRNKLKRLLREAFRLERHHFPPGIDVVLIPRQRQENFPLAELRQELVQLLQRVQRAPAGPPGGERRRPRP